MFNLRRITGGGSRDDKYRGGGRCLCAVVLLAFILSAGLFLSACGGGSTGAPTPGPGGGNPGDQNPNPQPQQAPAVTVSFGAASHSTMEGEAVAMVVTLSADPERNLVIPFTVTGTAAVDDYTGVPASVTFASGDTTKNITVAAVDDTEEEQSETVVLGFGTLPEGVSEGTRSSTTVTITDNDEPPAVTISFGQAAYSAAEGGSVSVAVTLSADPERSLVIPVTVTGTAAVDDYTGVPTSVTFASGDTTKSITVAATDDSAEEQSETVVLGFGTLPEGVSAGTPSSTTVTITDNDDPPPAVTVSFNRWNSHISEGETILIAKATLSADPRRTVTIPITVDTTTSTATTADYSLQPPSSVTFTSGETSKDIFLTAIDDTVDEANFETVVLGFGALPQRVSEGTPATATFTIVDNDPPAVTVSFNRWNSHISEGETILIAKVTLSADPRRTVTIPITVDTTTSTATTADYSLQPPSSVTFTSGETSKDIFLTAIDDTVDEANFETVVLGFGALPQRVSEGTPATATFTIVDNDDIVETELEKAKRIVDNHVCTSESTQAVDYATAGYSPETLQLSEHAAFPVQWDGTPFAVDISSSYSNSDELDTAIEEEAKRIKDVLGYEIIKGGDVITLGNVTTSQLYYFSSGSQLVPPDEKIHVRCCNDKSGNVAGTTYPWWRIIHLKSNSSSSRFIIVRMLYHALGLTSSTKQTEDLIQMSGPLKSGTPLTQEQIRQGLDGRNPTQSTAQDLAKLKCIFPKPSMKEEPVKVSFGTTSYSVTEGAAVSVAVTLSAGPESSVVVPFMVDLTSTAQDADYSLQPSSSVTFASGETSKSITLTATDDATDDNDETVIITFGTLPEGISPGMHPSTTVTINDVAETELEKTKRIVNDHVCASEAAQAVEFATAGYSPETLQLSEHAAFPSQWNGTPFAVDISSDYPNSDELDTAIEEEAKRIKDVLGYEIIKGGDVITLGNVTTSQLFYFSSGSQLVPPDEEIHVRCCNDKGGDIIGTAYPWWRIIHLKRDNKQSRHILMHELYHILGLSHSTDEAENLIQQSDSLVYGTPLTQEQIRQGLDGRNPTQSTAQDLAKLKCIFPKADE